MGRCGSQPEEFTHRKGLERFPVTDFFQFTPSLRVLDLSFTGLEEIPKSIGLLVELRHLNLFRTRIHTVPAELGNLMKLRYLDFGDAKLGVIFQSAISQLSMLQSLNLFNTTYQWPAPVDAAAAADQSLLKLEDLGALKNLEDLGVDVESNSHLQTVLGNQVLLMSTTRLSFIGIDFTGGEEQPMMKLASEKFPGLVELIIAECELPDDLLFEKAQLPHLEQLDLRRLKISSVVMTDGQPLGRLRILQIIGCPRLVEVSWTAHIPLLEELLIDKCHGVGELITTEGAEEDQQHECYFPKLYRLKLKYLRKLTKISGRRHPLIALPGFEISYLRKLPDAGAALLWARQCTKEHGSDSVRTTTVGQVGVGK